MSIMEQQDMKQGQKDDARHWLQINSSQGNSGMLFSHLKWPKEEEKKVEGE